MKSRKTRICIWGLTIVLSFVGLYSCTKADVTFGNQWINTDYTKTNMTDTFTPEISTIYLDSFSTNGTGYGVIGVYKDPAFGTVSASTYLQLQPPSVGQGIMDSLTAATFDSAVVYLRLRHNEYGDTTQNLSLSVNTLTRNINYYDNTFNLYNVSSIPTNATPIGTKTFTLNPNIGRPLTGDTLLIRVNDAFGQDLFSKVRNYASVIQNPTEFLTYLPGLKISGTATDNNGFIFNVSDSAFIRVYYSLPATGQRTHQYMDFTLNNNAYQFNNISIDRSNTVLGNLNIGRGNRAIGSVLTNNISYLQQSTQTAVKVTFPTIKAITYQSQYLRLVKAILTVEPETNSYLPYYAIPPSLSIAPTADNLNVYTESTGASSNASLSLSTRLYTYSFDVTNYINTTELPTENLTGRGLILFLPTSAYKSSVNRLLIGDVVNQKAGKGGIKLQLYYISVQ
ncbi:MAG: hypothetical protein DI598_01020 [Pseudopedobacter saltans]|uniref:DUF4270 domain-containing protein n=1 Tax=Pseudopedobacter saltans TaxID=151895 RepID=A0A2W5FF71_9SPHI|nr:MAG: hypothetical protein DI598_01020 [Pseudopedobacter saltans]